jgi:hypothetical protein
MPGRYVCPFLHEIVTPHMVRVLWAEPQAGAIVQPQSGAFRLFSGHFQAFFPPYPFNPLVVHSPTLVSK